MRSQGGRRYHRNPTNIDEGKARSLLFFQKVRHEGDLVILFFACLSFFPSFSVSGRRGIKTKYAVLKRHLKHGINTGFRKLLD